MKSKTGEILKAEGVKVGALRGKGAELGHSL